jgi:hypothetical protein
MDKERARHPTFRVPSVPEPEDLQMQFIHWLLARPSIPMLAAPANSGFYDNVYRSHPPQTGFFDDEYVDGKRSTNVGFPPRDLDLTPLNPARSASPTYHEVCTAILTTNAEIERHEERIYQVGYTPSAIRTRVESMLRDSSADQPILDFQEKDIPPPEPRRTHAPRLDSSFKREK